MADLCQTDYGYARPTEYFPETYRMGTCLACESEEFVARVSLSEALATRNDVREEMRLRNEAATRQAAENSRPCGHRSEPGLEFVPCAYDGTGLCVL